MDTFAQNYQVKSVLRLTRDNAQRSPVWINFQFVITFEESATAGSVIYLAADKAIRITVTESPATIENLLATAS